MGIQYVQCVQVYVYLHYPHSKCIPQIKAPINLHLAVLHADIIQTYHEVRLLKKHAQAWYSFVLQQLSGTQDFQLETPSERE